jgi:hypothetical protein
VSADDLELASRFFDALEEAAKTGDLERVYPFLAEGVEWMPRALSGIEEMRRQETWGTPPEKLDIEFEKGEIRELGEGRIELAVRQLYRMKSTGELAYTRDRQIEITLREGKVTRYDMKIVG